MEKFNYTGHKKLWNWLADNPKNFKLNYFEKNKINDDPLSNCYACDYTKLIGQNKHFRDCKYCPLSEWGNTVCFYENGLYLKWADFMEIREYKKACEIARQIANLPVREGVEYE